MSKVKIYTLSDPITLEVRYVGKTVQGLEKRLNQHLLDSKKFKNLNSNWLKSLKRKSLKPIIEELDEVDESKWIEAEIYWIAQLKAWGFNLNNHTIGGDGVSKGNIPWNKGIKVGISYNKGISPSEETKRKISEKLKGNKPWNTGTKGIKPPNSGSFTKGRIPQNKTILTLENIIEIKNLKTQKVTNKIILNKYKIGYSTLKLILENGITT